MAGDRRAAQPLPIEYDTNVTRPLKTAEATARDIVGDIVSAGLQTGDKLAAEHEMLLQYGVSRQSLREALRLLEVQGLIELRRGPGGGPVVGSVDAANLGRISTLYYHLAGVSYQEIVEAWALAEGQLAALVARRAHEPEVAAALAMYVGDDHDDGKPAAGATTDPTTGATHADDYAGLHMQFHQALGRLCGNKALELTLSTYGLVFAHHLLMELDPRGLGGTVDAQHRAIARAILAGHHKRAQELAEAHVSAIVAYYGEASGKSLDGLVAWR